MSTVTNLAAGHLEVARRYAASPDDWPLAPRFDPASRWYHRLDSLPSRAEVWLLTWLPGQGTPWHALARPWRLGRRVRRGVGFADRAHFVV